MPGHPINAFFDSIASFTRTFDASQGQTAISLLRNLEALLKPLLEAFRGTGRTRRRQNLPPISEEQKQHLLNDARAQLANLLTFCSQHIWHEDSVSAEVRNINNLQPLLSERDAIIVNDIVRTLGLRLSDMAMRRSATNNRANPMWEQQTNPTSASQPTASQSSVETATEQRPIRKPKSPWEGGPIR